ncbi:MoxR family ATPase [Paenibacillus urinalis]|uniref:MoxR family ATPase n=1 Tax=Paenibacillus urinalis TaxID=521520 RepID=A0AAX3N0G3_9BACL|nr:MoxR family ATPase [Paenibacillus urinalis]WDH83225.1 MoxR family ATPase [Paenibacillus urinalis]WDH99305.1 MoxR family ATPase [Paenibacillus urinalis]WDI02998.1 MoxR family ATPase [Paenibacillus urinalis]
MEFSKSSDYAASLLERLVQRVETVMVGKKQEIRLILIAMLSGGHILLEDVPGTGKTKLIKTIASCLGASFGRIQFTSDVMPSDVTGTSVFKPITGDFEYKPGPIMVNIVLGDEINRAAPRTQSSLLEAMEEKSVTVDGTTYALPKPFLLMATQNPMQFEGTFRLPEAQLDRFMMRLSLGYPTVHEEVEMMNRQGGSGDAFIRPVMLAEELVKMQREASAVFVDPVIKEYIAGIAAHSRIHPELVLGISPRGSIAWMCAAQAAAYMNGRMYVIPDDVKEVAIPVLSHRIRSRADLSHHYNSESIIRSLLQEIPIPVQPARARG